MIVEYYAEQINKQGEKREHFLCHKVQTELMVHETFPWANIFFEVVSIEFKSSFHIKAICHETKINYNDKKSNTQIRTSNYSEDGSTFSGESE